MIAFLIMREVPKMRKLNIQFNERDTIKWKTEIDKNCKTLGEKLYLNQLHYLNCALIFYIIM